MPPFLADVLTWPGNRSYITAIKAAINFSVPPTVLMLNDRQPSDGWSMADKKLAIAFQILEDETCPDCGIPVWLGHSDDETILFEIKSTVCYSCATIEKAKEKKTKRAPSAGTKRYIALDENSEQPTRGSFYQRQADIIKDSA